MSNLVKFVDRYGNTPKHLYPVPAKDILPDWYKATTSHYQNKKKIYGKDMTSGLTSGTVKKCIPVFDALTAGYIIVTTVDISVTSNYGESEFTWSSEGAALGTHPIGQADLHPYVSGDKRIMKFANPWGIQTPKGYSCLFIPPVHRESVFKILEGVVDTDTYLNPVELPFVLTDRNFNGIIPAGTPMAQVIPFKRESYRMEISFAQEDIEKQKGIFRDIRSTFFNSYKDRFWSKKNYS
jgi:hypothetical protein